MSCLDQSELDYQLWRVGTSRCDLRGPSGDTDAPFVAVLGGTEAFGRFVRAPYPALLGEHLGTQVLNLSAMHAGLTHIRSEREILRCAARADTVVFQVLGAQNMSNPFYTVHPRRNDRFIAASERLYDLFPTVDFTGFNFTGHLLQTLQAVDPWAFDTLVETLRATWIETMTAVLDALPTRVVLFWMSVRGADSLARGAAAAEPAFVDREMLEALDGRHAGLVEMVASPAACHEGIDGMAFAPGEANAAARLPGPLFHAEAAEALAAALADEKRRAGDADAPLVRETAIRAFR